MMHYKSLVFSLALGCALCQGADARNPDGTLGLIRTPNNGLPVIITAGDVFEATVTSEATLALVNDNGAWPLEAEWKSLPGGLQQARCQAPDDVPPGEYALYATSSEHEDNNRRAVFVFETIPEEYLIAHVTDTHIGTTRHPREDMAIIADVIEAVNTSEAAFALITGDLTENGAEAQFLRFMEVLDTCRLPTFVVPGNHDRMPGNYERFFGPHTYRFWFGADGYLGFDTKDFLIADSMTPQDGRLHYYRRQLRPARWSVGFTHRYDVTMGMRAQLILFVDDPLDYLMYGHYHREAGDQDGIPWGRTTAIMTPAAINGQLRFIEVDSQGIRPLETVTAASLQAAPDHVDD